MTRLEPADLLREYEKTRDRYTEFSSKNAELVDDPFYRAFIIAVRALESLAGCAR
jgi:hypothetical protein